MDIGNLVIEESCYECSKHTSGLCFDCQQQDFAEMELFNDLTQECDVYNVFPEGGHLPEGVRDLEEWMISLLEKAGVDESVVSYWRGNLNAVRKGINV